MIGDEKQVKDYFSVSFRIFGDNLDPHLITGLLEIEPDIIHEKGDPRTLKAKGGKILHCSSYNYGLWCVKSKLDKHSRIQEHIGGILKLIASKKEILAELSNNGYKMDFFCGYFFAEADQPGISIDYETLQKIGELGINLGIDLYATL